jgi:phosphatidylethanolamine-binding protein (PEBP) family uncharacterized protein
MAKASRLETVQIEMKLTLAGRIIGGGALLPMERVQGSEPLVVEYAAPAQAMCCLIMYDEDADDYLHWLVTNIPGDRVWEGDVVVPYRAPSPPAGPAHRYHVAVYTQSDEQRIAVEGVQGGRGFSLHAFISEQHLTLLDHAMFRVQRGS